MNQERIGDITLAERGRLRTARIMIEEWPQGWYVVAYLDGKMAEKSVAFEHRHRPQSHSKPKKHRAGAGEAAVGQRHDSEFSGQRRMSGHAGYFTDRKSVV